MMCQNYCYSWKILHLRSRWLKLVTLIAILSESLHGIESESSWNEVKQRCHEEGEPSSQVPETQHKQRRRNPQRSIKMHWSARTVMLLWVKAKKQSLISKGCKNWMVSLPLDQLWMLAVILMESFKNRQWMHVKELKRLVLSSGSATKLSRNIGTTSSITEVSRQWRSQPKGKRMGESKCFKKGEPNMTAVSSSTISCCHHQTYLHFPLT